MKMTKQKQIDGLNNLLDEVNGTLDNLRVQLKERNNTITKQLEVINQLKAEISVSRNTIDSLLFTTNLSKTHYRALYAEYVKKFGKDNVALAVSPDTGYDEVKS